MKLLKTHYLVFLSTKINATSCFLQVAKKYEGERGNRDNDVILTDHWL